MLAGGRVEDWLIALFRAFARYSRNGGKTSGEWELHGEQRGRDDGEIPYPQVVVGFFC